MKMLDGAERIIGAGKIVNIGKGNMQWNDYVYY